MSLLRISLIDKNIVERSRPSDTANALTISPAKTRVYRSCLHMPQQKSLHEQVALQMQIVIGVVSSHLLSGFVCQPAEKGKWGVVHTCIEMWSKKGDVAECHVREHGYDGRKLDEEIIDLVVWKDSGLTGATGRLPSTPALICSINIPACAYRFGCGCWILGYLGISFMNTMTCYSDNVQMFVNPRFADALRKSLDLPLTDDVAVILTLSFSVGKWHIITKTLWL